MPPGRRSSRLTCTFRRRSTGWLCARRASTRTAITISSNNNSSNEGRSARCFSRMKLRVHHRTEYVYSQPARNNNNELRMQPLHNEWQQRRFHILRVVPSAKLRQFADFHANGVHHFEVEEEHQRLLIEVE